MKIEVKEGNRLFIDGNEVSTILFKNPLINPIDFPIENESITLDSGLKNVVTGSIKSAGDVRIGDNFNFDKIEKAIFK